MEMKINHLNLCVPDLSEAIMFFQVLFGFQVIEQKGTAIAVMDDGLYFTALDGILFEVISINI